MFYLEKLENTQYQIKAEREMRCRTFEAYQILSEMDEKKITVKDSLFEKVKELSWYGGLNSLCLSILKRSL